MKKIKSIEKIYRAGLHIPVGIFNVFCLWVNPIYGILFFVGFFAYEITEDWRIKDFGYLDIFGWLIGFALGVTALFIYQNIFC